MNFKYMAIIILCLIVSLLTQAEEKLSAKIWSGKLSVTEQLSCDNFLLRLNPLKDCSKNINSTSTCTIEYINDGATKERCSRRRRVVDRKTRLICNRNEPGRRNRIEYDKLKRKCDFEYRECKIEAKSRGSVADSRRRISCDRDRRSCLRRLSRPKRECREVDQPVYAYLQSVNLDLKEINFREDIKEIKIIKKDSNHEPVVLKVNVSSYIQEHKVQDVETYLNAQLVNKELMITKLVDSCNQYYPQLEVPNYCLVENSTVLFPKVCLMEVKFEKTNFQCENQNKTMKSFLIDLQPYNLYPSIKKVKLNEVMSL